MSPKGLSVLQAVIDLGEPVSIKWVVVGEDRNVNEDFSSHIRELALANNIPIIPKEQEIMPNCDLRLAASWKWLIPIEQEPPLVIMHDSLLPKLRGFNPLVTALIQGDTQIGVSAIIATPEFDKGDVIAQEVISVEYPIKIADAITSLSRCYYLITLEVLKKLTLGQMFGFKQDETLATYSLWRDHNDYFIDWSNSADSIQRFVNAVGPPYLGARVISDNQILSVGEVEVRTELVIANRTPGKVIQILRGNPLVVCGEGIIEIKEMSFTDSGLNALPWASLRTRFV